MRKQTRHRGWLLAKTARKRAASSRATRKVAVWRLGGGACVEEPRAFSSVSTAVVWIRGWSSHQPLRGSSSFRSYPHWVLLCSARPLIIIIIIIQRNSPAASWQQQCGKLSKCPAFTSQELKNEAFICFGCGLFYYFIV